MLIALLLLPLGMAQSLSTAGGCPGPVTIAFDGLTPGGTAVFLMGAAGEGSDVIGACAGTETGLAGLRFATRITVPGDGNGSFYPTVPGDRCDAPFQVLDVATCTMTNVDSPGSGDLLEGSSCQSIKLADPGAGSGVYSIDTDGDGPAAPYDLYCEMDVAGGGWTVQSYIRDSSQWDWGLFEDSGVVGDVDAGFASGATLNTMNDSFTEKIIIYNRLVENSVDELGQQWMSNTRPDAVTYDNINVSSGWDYIDSYGYSDVNESDVCTHGCWTYRGFGMSSSSGGDVSYCGTQTGDYGCPEGNNICWVPRSDGCNVDDRRCSYLSGPGEGVVYGVR
ncbi:MAG: hypothetical protein ACI8PZ_006570 [Myxococcota bacterium]|jgi:hypothetical protein